MYTYTNKEGLATFTIPFANIDYARLSKGIASDKTWIAKYYHALINRYNNSEFVTVLYKKDKGGPENENFVHFDGVEALQQLSLVSKGIEDNTNVN